MNRKRTTSRYLLNLVPLFVLIVVLIAVPAALLLFTMSDAVQAGGKTGFKIKVLAKEGPPIYIPVDVNDSEVSGTFSRTIPAELGGHKDQSWSYTGKIDERQITGRLSFHETCSIPNCGESEMNYEVSSTVLVIDDNNARSDWVTTTGNGRNKKTSYTFPVTLKLTADLTPLIEAGYEFGPAGTTGKTDGNKTLATTTTKKESDAKSRGAVATITAALAILLAGAASKFAAAAAAATMSATSAFAETKRPSALADYAEMGDIPDNLIPVWKNTLSMEKQAMLDEIRGMREGGEIDVSEYKILTADVFNPGVTENEAVLRINVAREYKNALRETSLGSAGRPVDTYRAFRETYGVGREELIRMREKAQQEYWDWKGKEGELREDYEIKDAYHQATRPDRLPDYDPTGILDGLPPKPPEAEFVDADQLSKLARHRLDVANEKMASAETRIRAINARLKFTSKAKGNK
ncbi:MAG: hypothetical protein V1748_07410 [Actinomycetota bacterium]